MHLCTHCLSRTGMHLLGGWRLLPVGEMPAPCPQCGLGWGDFARSGRYGCPHCAAAFAPTFRQASAVDEAPLQRELAAPLLPPVGEELDLSLALLLEDYELAARIRDSLEDTSAEASPRDSDKDTARWTS